MWEVSGECRDVSAVTACAPYALFYDDWASDDGASRCTVPLCAGQVLVAGTAPSQMLRGASSCRGDTYVSVSGPNEASAANDNWWFSEPVGDPTRDPGFCSLVVHTAEYDGDWTISGGCHPTPDDWPGGIWCAGTVAYFVIGTCAGAYDDEPSPSAAAAMAAATAMTPAARASALQSWGAAPGTEASRAGWAQPQSGWAALQSCTPGARVALRDTAPEGQAPLAATALDWLHGGAVVSPDEMCIAESCPEQWPCAVVWDLAQPPAAAPPPPRAGSHARHSSRTIGGACRGAVCYALQDLWQVGAAPPAPVSNATDDVVKHVDNYAEFEEVRAKKP